MRYLRKRLRRADGGIFLDRWGIEIDWFGGIFLHRMTAPDPGVDLHDHPWSFVSWIVKGGYVEQRARTREAVVFAAFAARAASCTQGYRETRRRWSVRALRLDECHRIETISGPVCWTIMVHGPKRGGWGFYPPEGYIGEQEYDRTRRRDVVETR